MSNRRTQQVKKRDYDLKSSYKDLRKVFGIQLEEFSRQFITTCADVEKFMVDYDNNQDYLEDIINNWCEKEETTVSDDLDASTAIFMLAVIDKIDNDTADEEEPEEGGPFSSQSA